MPVIAKKMALGKEQTHWTYFTVSSWSNRTCASKRDQEGDGARQPRYDTRQAKSTPSRRQSAGSALVYHRWGRKAWQTKAGPLIQRNAHNLIDERRSKTGVKHVQTKTRQEELTGLSWWWSRKALFCRLQKYIAHQSMQKVLHSHFFKEFECQSTLRWEQDPQNTPHFGAHVRIRSKSA